SGGKGSSRFSPGCWPSAGRLFFFSLPVGGWRRDCPSVKLKPMPASRVKTTTKGKSARPNFTSLMGNHLSLEEKISFKFQVSSSDFMTVRRHLFKLKTRKLYPN